MPARERAAEDAAVAGLQLGAQVDDLDLRQRPWRDCAGLVAQQPLGQLEELVAAVFRVEALSTSGVAVPSTRTAPVRRQSSSAARRAW